MSVLITREQVAAKTAERYRRQYGPNYGMFAFGDSAEICRKLEALGPAPAVADVEAIVPGWTVLKCEECKEEVDQVVQVGDQEPDYESSTACICWRCATDAVALFRLP